jgi:bacteriorhodopsin
MSLLLFWVGSSAVAYEVDQGADNVSYESAPVTSFAPVTSYGVPVVNYDLDTCAMCDECITSSGECAPSSCIQEVSPISGVLTTGACSFQQCSHSTRPASCLQPSKSLPFEIAFGIQALHLGLLIRDVQRANKGGLNIISVLTGSFVLFDTLAYLILAGGSGFLIRCCDGRLFYYARAISWLFTTPIMLFVLSVITNASTATTCMLVILDGLMIVSGGLASTFCTPMKWYLFAFSTLCFIPILHYMVTKYSNTQVPMLLGVRKALRWYSLIWVAYAVVWVLSSGTGVICVGLENILYIVLDIIAKATLSVGARKFASMASSSSGSGSGHIGWFAPTSPLPPTTPQSGESIL